jgi:hypothetical protein
MKRRVRRAPASMPGKKPVTTATGGKGTHAAVLSRVFVSEEGGEPEEPPAEDDGSLVGVIVNPGGGGTAVPLLEVGLPLLGIEVGLLLVGESGLLLLLLPLPLEVVVPT